MLQLLLEQCLTDEISDEKGTISNLLVLSLQIIYAYVPVEGSNLVDQSNWLLEFCKKNNLYAHSGSLIHKLLFFQRIRAHSDDFFDAIAVQIGDILGQITVVCMPFVLRIRAIIK